MKGFWRKFHRILPVKLARARRGVVQEVGCQRCEAASESMEHVFF